MHAQRQLPRAYLVLMHFIGRRAPGSA